MFDHAKYQSERRARRRAEYFSDKVCEWCGSSEDLVPHHLDKASKITSNIWHRSWKTIHEEMKKCIVVCNACHLEHHAQEKRKELIHGTNSGYYKGCKCVECRKAHAAHNQKYRKLSGVEK